MAVLREPRVDPLTRLEDKLRTSSPLVFRGTRVTADGIEVEAIDTQTGQVALLTLSPVNVGQCPMCSHVDHVNASRCEGILSFTKEMCPCRSAYGMFPKAALRA